MSTKPDISRATVRGRKKTNRAFTLIELVVAIGLLALVLSFSGVIFKIGIESYRTGGASSEIMLKLRAITDQLNSDFAGLRPEAPLLIWFIQDTNGVRYDQIMFFANGDFQSTRLYPNSPIRGNVARIHYGQARVNGYAPWNQDDESQRILARRQHILTVDLPSWFNSNNFADFNSLDTSRYIKNEFYEYDPISLAQWQTVDRAIYADTIIPSCFYRPYDSIDYGIMTADPNTYHKLMCEGVGSLAIQWAYWDANDQQLRWFPSDNPDGDAGTPDSHFGLMSQVTLSGPYFGIFFNVPGGATIPALWFPIGHPDVEYDLNEGSFASSFYPKALRFTFTLYDSRAILEGGRTFTHVVYLEH